MQTRSRDHNYGGTSARPLSSAPSTRPSIFVIRPTVQKIGPRGRTAWADIASQRSTEAVGLKLALSPQALSYGKSNSVTRCQSRPGPNGQRVPIPDPCTAANCETGASLFNQLVGAGEQQSWNR